MDQITELRSDYGEIKLISVEDGSDFWILADEMTNYRGDLSPMTSDRPLVVESFKKGSLYSLRMTETGAMFQRGAREDPLFSRSYLNDLSFYIIPCIIIVEEGVVLWIWVHPRARRLGFGRQLVKLSEATSAPDQVQGSEPFWKSIGL